MKKKLAFILILLMFFGISGNAFANSTIPIEDESIQEEAWAAQAPGQYLFEKNGNGATFIRFNTRTAQSERCVYTLYTQSQHEAGEVTVWLEGGRRGTLYIQYIAATNYDYQNNGSTGNWNILDTKLHITINELLIPRTIKICKRVPILGEPIPRLFAYQERSRYYQGEGLYKIPMARVVTNMWGEVVIAAYASAKWTPGDEDPLEAAAEAVGAAETAVAALAGDGTDEQSAIDAAQAVHDAAQALVEALPEGSEKDDLLGRLEDIQDLINNAQDALDALDALTEATEETAAAEGLAAGLAGDGSDSQSAIDAAQAAHDAAQAVVEALPDGTEKDELLGRLQEVQELIDNAQAMLDIICEVEEAYQAAQALAGDGTDSQAEIDDAQAAHDSAALLVAGLPDGTIKDAANTRLADAQALIDNAQDSLDLWTATLAVDAAKAAAEDLAGDGSDTQQAIDDAQALHDDAKTLVDDLPDVWSAEKVLLTGYLGDAQNLIDDAQAMLDIKTAVEAAETAAATLKGDGTDTQGEIDAVKDLYDAAKDLVEALEPADSLRIALTPRLEAVQVLIDAAQDELDYWNAYEAVRAAEDAADDLVGDGSDQQQVIDDAQALYDTAKTLVNALPEGTEKDDLLGRLSVVKDKIDSAQAFSDLQTATAAVDAAKNAAQALAGDGSDTQQAMDDAQALHDDAMALVTALPDEYVASEKASLLGYLNNAQDLINEASAFAEASEAVEAARTAASGLNLDGSDSQSEIDEVQGYYDTAMSLVDDLPDGSAKDALLAYLNDVMQAVDTAQDNLEATEAVEEAYQAAQALAGDGTDSQAAINAAQDAHDAAALLVTALPDGTIKDAANTRLADAQTLIDNAQNTLDLWTATMAVDAAKAAAEALAGDGSDMQQDIHDAQALHDTAETLVNDLPDVWSAEKVLLTGYLENAQNLIDDAQAMLDIKTAVEVAETAAAALKGDGTDTQGEIDAVKDLYDAAKDLVDALEPADSLRIALTPRLEAVQVLIDAAQDELDYWNAYEAVRAAEDAADDLVGDGSDQQQAIDDARTLYDAAAALVNELPEGTEKDDLLGRLSAVKDKIDSAQALLDLRTATDAVDAARHAAEDLLRDGSDTQQAIGDAQDLHDEAMVLVEALPDEYLASEKASLLGYLEDAQNQIDEATAFVEATEAVEVAETIAAALIGDGTDTQQAIDAAQDAHDAAAILVDDLPDGPEKDELTVRLISVQQQINDAY